MAAGIEALIVQVNQIANIAFISLSNLKHLVIPSNNHPEQSVTMISVVVNWRTAVGAAW
jgi:hypothetical protein